MDAARIREIAQAIRQAENQQTLLDIADELDRKAGEAEARPVAALEAELATHKRIVINQGDNPLTVDRLNELRATRENLEEVKK